MLPGRSPYRCCTLGGSLLQLTSSASGPAEKVFHQIMSNIEAAFTAALSVLGETLALATGQDLKIMDLEKEQARVQALAIFRDPIEVFRVVAEKTGRAPIKARTSRSGQCADLSAWCGIRQVADAVIKEFYQGKDMHPELLRSMLSKGALPNDFWSCNAAMTCRIDWLDNGMQRLY